MAEDREQKINRLKAVIERRKYELRKRRLAEMGRDYNRDAWELIEPYVGEDSVFGVDDDGVDDALMSLYGFVGDLVYQRDTAVQLLAANDIPLPIAPPVQSRNAARPQPKNTHDAPYLLLVDFLQAVREIGDGSLQAGIRIVMERVPLRTAEGKPKDG